MSDVQIGMLALAVFTIIFNAGGFVWLAKNHVAHVQGSLDRMEERIIALEKAMARVEGYCQSMHNRD